MISVEDARERILGFFARLDMEERAISDALGQVITEDIVGRFDVPPWDNSAMDGYALRAADIEDTHPNAPVTLSVIGSIAAGEVPTQSVQRRRGHSDHDRSAGARGFRRRGAVRGYRRGRARDGRQDSG